MTLSINTSQGSIQDFGSGGVNWANEKYWGAKPPPQCNRHGCTKGADQTRGVRGDVPPEKFGYLDA